MRGHVWSVAVEEDSLEELHAEDAEDEEAGAADHHDVADGLEAGQQGLHQSQLSIGTVLTNHSSVLAQF